MRVIGTAGHVDHGKSTLIETLTGTHPDRLKEEKAREMTIELGFAWMTLPNGEEVGIVDVPGHRDFIANMLSGIGGIDAALLVIAADEGIMPQTKEHLAILNLLNIPAGVIAMTKTDLVPDPDWLDLIEIDIRNAVKETALQDAPIVKVSARNKTGMGDLLLALETILKNAPPRADLNRPRLPIDRVFTMSGFGTVVTGTLLDGSFSVGDEVEILPKGVKGRIRGLQTHKKTEETAVPGSRTAVNLAGVDMDSIQRGDVVAHPDQYQATRRLDAHFTTLKDIHKPLAHGDEVKFFVAASETLATLRILSAEEIQGGEAGWVQLELRDPVVVLRGDRYILRRPSPGETLGGGTIVDPQPKGRHKRFDASVLKSLESLSQGSPADILFETAHSLGIATAKEVIEKSHLESTLGEQVLRKSIESGRLLRLNEGDFVITKQRWSALQATIIQWLDSYHAEYPLRRGMPREELKNKSKLASKIFNSIVSTLAMLNSISEERGFISKPGYKIQFNGQDQVKVEGLRRAFESNPFSPPSLKECQALAGEEIVNALIESGELVAVSQDVIFRRTDYDEMVKEVKALITKNGQATLAEVRDALKTTRKYAQALLEHLDSTGITQRSGEARILRK